MKSTASVNGINPNSRNFPKLTWDASRRPSRRPLINTKTTKGPKGSRLFPAPLKTAQFPNENHVFNTGINERFHPQFTRPLHSDFRTDGHPQQTLGLPTSYQNWTATFPDLTFVLLRLHPTTIRHRHDTGYRRHRIRNQKGTKRFQRATEHEPMIQDALRVVNRNKNRPHNQRKNDRSPNHRPGKSILDCRGFVLHFNRLEVAEDYLADFCAPPKKHSHYLPGYRRGSCCHLTTTFKLAKNKSQGFIRRIRRKAPDFRTRSAEKQPSLRR